MWSTVWNYCTCYPLEISLLSSLCKIFWESDSENVHRLVHTDTDKIPPPFFKQKYPFILKIFKNLEETECDFHPLLKICLFVFFPDTH